jgi:ubiquinone/menaquinone biosynthesis C-methylase UbiE
MTSAIDRVARAARRAAYGAGQAARIFWHTGHYVVGRRNFGPVAPAGSAAAAGEFGPLDRKRLRDAFREIFDRDWRNIAAGEYLPPHELSNPPDPVQLFRRSRDYLRDAARVARRKRERGHSEICREPLKSNYPRYFLQNFHYQTDGWMSADSADRYDMQVETLFTGSAAAMRRQALPAIRRAIGARDPARLTLLDLGCGAGSFLREVRRNWPGLNLIGLDLSPAYLGKARTALGGDRFARFIEANAEATEIAARSIDIVVAVYLFHELPPAARRRAASEIARILNSGGAFVLVDAIQYGDEPGLDPLLENFPRALHEPYFDGYCREDLAGLFGAAGLRPVSGALAFLSKVVAFEKV